MRAAGISEYKKTETSFFIQTRYNLAIYIFLLIATLNQRSEIKIYVPALKG